MRRKAKTDNNQKEIVSALRLCGFSVLSLHQVGKGLPDLLCKLPYGKIHLVEVKNGDRKGKLNDKQIEFHAVWGPFIILSNVDEAVEFARSEKKAIRAKIAEQFSRK